MAKHPWLDPNPFFFKGNSTGVMLIHGYTGAPPEVRPMGEYLAAQGYTVAGPLLAGHGTAWQDLNQVRWQDWVEGVEGTLGDLQARCDRVFVGGLSLGSLLTLYLGRHHAELDGLIAMAPALVLRTLLVHLAPLAKYFIKKLSKIGEDVVDPETASRLWSYPAVPVAAVHEVLKLQRIVRRELGEINQPILIFQGRQDRTVSLKGAPLLYHGVWSQDKELVWLENSGHCLSVDAEREAVWAKTHAWIQARV